MKYFAQTMSNHIRNQVQQHIESSGQSRKLMFMAPSLPITVVDIVCNQLLEYCKKKGLSSPLIKIAQDLCTEWYSSGDPIIKEYINKFEESNWCDNQGNLTSYRNAQPPKDQLLIVLLIGVDKITDSSSLADFYQCDFDIIWSAELKRRFDQWIQWKLDQTSSIGYEFETIKHFNQVLLPLVEKGIADILQISNLLEELDLSAAMDGNDAEQILLQSLDRFGLPPFMSYRFDGSKSFGPLIDVALSFFSYSTFIEENNRKKAKRKIKKFRCENALGDYFDNMVRASFDSDQAFVDAIEKFIDEDDDALKEELFRCDFIKIYNIINYKGKKTGPKTKTVTKKLSGSPVEVILKGLWLTLAEYKKLAADGGLFAHEVIKEIDIEAKVFKHDKEGIDAQDRKQNAEAYLKRVIGGLDALIEEYIDTENFCESGNTFPIRSKLFNDSIDYVPARTGEPFLEFHISIYANGMDEPCIKRFAWRMPAIHSYRVADELIKWCAEKIKQAQHSCLPVFNVPFYEELMLAKDDEESRRILQLNITKEDADAINLLDSKGVNTSDQILVHLRNLAYKYEGFINQAAEKGLHAAIINEFDGLQKSYKEVFGAFLSNPACANTPLSAFLFRAFLIIEQKHVEEDERWVWNPYEQSAVVTVLHPALLEMLQAQILYLLSSFSAVASNALKQPARTSFRESVWQNFLDLSAIQMPLMGLIVNPDKILSTNISGQDLIHRIGEKSKAEASLTTRLLLRYDAFEEEDITDAELFRISRESSLLLNILHDYKKLHPHAQDGLTIAVYQNHDIQPLIAAVNQFLKETQINRDEHLRKYVITITVFTESSDDTSLSRWIAQWQERWENAESQESMRHYRRCHLSIAHRIVSSENYYRQFRQLLSDGFNADIIFLNNFIEARGKGNDFQTVEQYDVTTRTLKFPITEKSFCAFRDYHLQPIRTRILSNRQFRLSTQHAELMARLKNNAPQNTNHVVLGYGDYTPWHRVVDDLHERGEWVVCIDPNIDEKLIRFKGTDAPKPREIIGFGSGVGAYGESNYTISTEQFQLSDILNRLKAAIGDIYQGWDSTIFEDVASSVLKESQKLSGLSLVRATGIGQNIRDFMAYALARKLVSDKDCKLCDHLVSLDAYRHWFESADSDTRPDLLWLCASIDKDGYLNLHLRLIECKLSQQSDEHISKARQQIENGLKHLITVFMPKRKDDVIEDFRPDQRYWWLQLHRLIASKAEIEGQDQARALMALERLSEGEFRVKWTAAVLTFWTDSDSSEIKINDEWEYQYEDNVLTINVLAAGKTLVKHLCESNDKKSIEVPWDNEGITFDGVEKIKQKVEKEPEEVEGENPEEQATVEPVPGVVATSNEEQAKEEQESHDVVKKEVPDRIFLGKTSSGGKSVYWEYGHKDLNNRHMLLFGTSGMGKTYAIQCLLCELGLKNLNSLIIDYTSGFFDNQLEEEFVSLLNPYQHIVRKRPIAINPFRQQFDIIGDELVPEHEGNTAQRITGVFGEVYRLGDQQKSALYQAIKQGLSTQGSKGMTMSDLIPYLEELATEKGTSGTSASSVISKIRPFIDQNPFGEEDPESWERLFNDNEHKSHVLQLAGFLRDGARLITEFSLIDLYWFYRASGSKDLPRVVVLDEVQNLDHREESPLAQLLREGRKFGFSLILATQIMSDLEKDERDRLFNAAHKLFFRPADTEIKTYAEIAANTTNEKIDTWVKRLASLGKTECYSLGPSLNEATGSLEIKAYKIKIASLIERNIHG